MRWILVPSAVALLACRGGGEGQAKLDPAATFEAASEEQADALCDELNRIGHRDPLYVERVCTSLAVTTAAVEGGSCEQRRDACIDDPMPLCWPAMDDVEELECPDATVGMFLDCMKGTLRATKELYADVTCATAPAELAKLAVENLAVLVDRPPPECDAFKAACPAFFADKAR